MPTNVSAALDLVTGGSMHRKLVQGQVHQLAHSQMGFIGSEAVARWLVAENLVRRVKQVGQEILYEPTGKDARVLLAQA